MLYALIETSIFWQEFPMQGLVL